MWQIHFVLNKGEYMDFVELLKIENESERVNRTYDIFNEDSRLNHSKAARVEFLTTVHYIEKYLKDGDKILDIGAGAGEYSLYFARKGYEVSALELADANIAAFKKNITPSVCQIIDSYNMIPSCRISQIGVSLSGKYGVCLGLLKVFDL